MTTLNLDYYRQRADEEMAAAERADDPGISQIHRELAQRYRDLLNEEAGRTSGAMAPAPGGVFDEPGLRLG